MGFIKIGKVGEIINSYQIEEYLGLGTYATSYRAIKDGRYYFFKDYKIDEKNFNEFYEHQRKMKEKLSSNKEIQDCTVQTLDLFKDEYCIYMVHPFLKGSSLRDFLNDVKRSDYKRRWYFATIFISSLEILHRNGIVHTDLKPDQIFLEEDPSLELKFKARIADFDFSIIKNESKPYEIVSTPGYESPEYLEGKAKVDFPSDIFTVGLILYEILLYKPPFPDGNQNNVYSKQKNYIIPRNVDRRISEKINDLMIRCLSYDPSSRPNAKELKEAFLEEINNSIKPFDLKENQDIEIERKPSVAKPVPPPAPAPAIETYKTIGLIWKGQELKIWRPFEKITNQHLRAISIDLYKIISKECFEVKNENGIWKVKGCKVEPGKEKIYVNGNDIENKEVTIKDGDKIKIGSFVIAVKGYK